MLYLSFYNQIKIPLTQAVRGSFLNQLPCRFPILGGQIASGLLSKFFQCWFYMHFLLFKLYRKELVRVVKPLCMARSEASPLFLSWLWASCSARWASYKTEHLQRYDHWLCHPRPSSLSPFGYEVHKQYWAPLLYQAVLNDGDIKGKKGWEAESMTQEFND